VRGFDGEDLENVHALALCCGTKNPPCGGSVGENPRWWL